MLISTLTKRFLRLKPASVLIVAILTGVFLIMVSFALDLAFFREGGKEKGYVFALNWSINYTIIIPLVLYFMISIMQDVPILLKNLYDKHMILTKKWKTVKSYNKILSLWLSHFDDVIRWGSILTIISILMAIVEWYLYSARPLLFGESFIPEFEYDWSVACLKNDCDGLHRLGNAIFVLIAYLYQGIVVAMLLCFFIFIVTFKNFIAELSFHPKKFRMTLCIDDNDNRRGFQVFSSLVENILFAALFYFFAIYLARLQQVYLRDTVSTTIYDFMKGFFQSTKYFLNPKLGDWTSFMSLTGGLILGLLMFFLSIVILRQSANKSREELVSYLKKVKNIPSHITKDLTRKQCYNRVLKMKVWPLEYISINQLLIFSFFAIICTIWYPVGLIYIGALIFTAVKHVVKKSKHKIIDELSIKENN